MYTIENDKLRVRLRTQGAELTSIYDKVNNIERLWQADPDVWGWHAPTLFPVVGRCLNDTITIDRREFTMEKHGFARKSNFEPLEQTAKSITFRLSYSPATLAVYPYHFDLYITYELKDNELHQTYEVENKGLSTMYFALGGHPAFAAPLLQGEQYEDYYIEFDADTLLDRHHIDGQGFFDGRQSNVLNGSNKLPLTKNMFADDALIFKDLKSRKISLKTDKNPRKLEMSYHNFDYLGLWAKVGAPYVCIEPWYGCADTAGKPTAFDKKEGVISLPSLGKFHASITITVS